MDIFLPSEPSITFVMASPVYSTGVSLSGVYMCATANIFFAVNQVVPIAVQKDTMDTEDILLLEAVCTVSLQELEQIGLDDIGSIDKNSSYACSFIHIPFRGDDRQVFQTNFCN